MASRVPMRLISLEDLHRAINVYVLLHRQHITDRLCCAVRKGRIDKKTFVQLLKREIGSANVASAIRIANEMSRCD